jgi:hypothetical protein
MSETIYLAFDLFHAAAYAPLAAGNRPAAYAAGDERYTHDRGWFYAVLQPFLISSGSEDDSPSLSTYLRDWNDARLAQPGALRFLDETVVAELRAKVQAQTAPVSVIPVPFPADATLGFVATWTGGGAMNAQRSLTAGTFDFPLELWPEFAGRNHMPVPIETIAHLDDGQKAQLIAWTYGLMQTLVRKADMRILSEEKLQQLIADRVVTALEARVLRLLLTGRPLGPVPPPPALPVPLPIDDFAAWRPHLEALLVPLFEQTLWRNADLRNEPTLNPPTLRYSTTQLRSSAFGLAMMGAVAPPPSYHQRLIQQMLLVSQADERRAQEGDRTPPQAPPALARLFGFGERLRFRKLVDPATEHDFMIVRTTDEGDANWFVTNAQSLLGQVFRVGPVTGAPADLDFQLTSLTVAARQLLDANTRQRIAAQVDRAHAEAAALEAQAAAFGGRLARTGDDRVFFLPRHARAAALSVTHPDGTPLFEVPGSLLDLLVDAPRTEAPAGAPGLDLTRANPQRLRLAASDLFQNGAYAAWNGVRRFTRVKVRLARLPVAAAPEKSAAYAMSFSLNPPPEEIAALSAEAAAMLPQAALWVSVSEETSDGKKKERLKPFPLINAVSDVRSAPFTAVVLDRTGALTAMLPSRDPASPEASGDSEASGGPLPQEGIAVDLVWPSIGSGAALDPNETFNVVAAADPAAVPLFILGREFEYRVTRSADRITSRFALTLNPAPPMTAAFDADPDDTQPILGHFANFNKLRIDLVRDGAAPLRLNHPDALVPSAAASGASFSYDVTHQFAEEVRQDLADSETNRYAAYRDAGLEWLVCGQIEHQYSHKLPVDGGARLRLPLSTGIRNLASMSAQQPGNKHPVYALSFDIVPPTPESPDEQLRLTLSHDFLATTTAAAVAAPAALRPLYEALFDLAASVRSTQPGRAALLRLEAWNFDNTRRPPVPNAIANADASPEFPDIASSMRFDGAAEYVLDAADIDRFTALLGDDFAAFRRNVANQAANLQQDIALASPRWIWTGVDGAPPLPLSDTTNAVRLRLTIGRDDTRAIGSEYVQNDDQFVPLRAPAERENRDNPELAAFAGLSFDAMRGKAREQLARTLDPGEPLRTSAEWVRSVDITREQVLATRDDEDRALKLLGESYPFLNFPDELARGVETPVRMFHVPFGFVPLREHSGFGDPQTTFEFAEYLVNLLASLLRGQLPEEGQIAAEPSLDAAVDHLGALQAFVRKTDGLADAILALLERIDAPGGSDELFKAVDALVEASTADRRAVLRELIAADPSVFVTAKAIAAGVFDPQTFSSKLFAVQLRKRIREGVNSAALIAEDTDRFTFNRFFGRGSNRFLVDVIDDRSYDDDYEMAGAAGRTGEDLLENRHRFDEPPPALPAPAPVPSVAVDVAHYNSEWITRRNGEDVKTYRLPSRRFPRTPKPVAPRASEHRRSTMPRANLGLGIDGQFAPALASVMPAAIELTTTERGATALRAESRAETRATVRGDAATGWHHLDSYVSHYYFVVEPDEDGVFVNDVFEITVRRSKSAAAPIPPVPPFNFVASTPLQKWFVYHKRKEEAQLAASSGAAAPAVEPPTDRLTIAEILAEAEKWIVAPPAAAPFNGERLLRRREQQASGEATILYTATPGAPLLQPPAVPANPAPDDDPPFGTVIAAELMAFPGNDAASVLHLAVLDDVWNYQRVRVRVLRNGIDINGNKRVDINPAFGTTSRFSEWVDHGRDVITLDAERHGFQPLVARLTPTLAIDTWLNATTASLSFGPIVRNAVTASFQDADNGGALRTLWNQRHVLSDDITISAVVLQPLEDTHPRQRGNTPLRESDQSRGDLLTKQILAPRRGPDADSLTERISKADVLTLTPNLRVTWWKDGRLPLMQVTWPIRW